MKKFKTKIKNNNKIDLVLISIFIITLILLHFYDRNLKVKMLDITESKMEELTNMYIKKNIIYEEIDLNKLLIINKNNKGEIIYIDVDTNYANKILNDVSSAIQNSIFELEGNDEIILKTKDDSLYIELPLGISLNGLLFSNVGPKVPIKLDLYEYSFGTIETKIEDYGLNNAMLKVYLYIDLEQKIIIPYTEKKMIKRYEALLASRIINGSIPELIGTNITKTSNKINN